MQKFGFINGVDIVNWPPYRESLYGGQFTLSTPLIKPNFCILLPHRRSTTVSLETTPFIHLLELLSTALALTSCFIFSQSFLS